MLAGSEEDRAHALESIARKIGMAFQIRDDILDVESTREELGKPVHSDEKNQKTTYVTLNGLRHAKEETERLSREAIRELEIFGPQDPFLEMLLESLIRVHDLTGGCIKLNGKDVREYDLDSLREKFSYVFQDVFLFSNTIDSNIAYAQPDIGRQQVYRAAMHADRKSVV